MYMASFTSLKKNNNYPNTLKDSVLEQNIDTIGDITPFFNYHKTKNTFDHLNVSNETTSVGADDPTTSDHFYNPFNIHHIQQYNPLYSVFFELNERNYNNVSFNHKYQCVFREKAQVPSKIIDITTGKSFDKDLYIKFSPLIDPVRYMAGKYGTSNVLNTNTAIKLPTFTGNTGGVKEGCKTIESKLAFIHNASYVDCLFYYLSSVLLNKFNFQHGIDYYGSYLGIQEHFKINIEEDVDYLDNFDFFKSNIDKLFILENLKTSLKPDSNMSFSNGNRQKIRIYSEKSKQLDLDVILPIEIADLDTCNGIQDEPMELYSKLNVSKTNENSSEEDDENSSEEDDENSSEEDDENSSEEDDENSSEEDDDINDDEKEDEDGDEKEDDEDSDEEWEDEDDENPNNETHAYIKNFPIQLICMEKCDGTLDQLFMDDLIDEKTGISALFQIIMTLIVYQKVFHFTHNDLHTNNITYVNTNEKYLYYKYNNISYRVPTYGRIYKIIDFGRAIYKFQNKLFCSDSFSPQGDASTQYNFPPFHNPKKTSVLPNYSFDLCRLGCSIYDFIIDGNNYKPSLKNLDKFQRIIYEWCLDDNGKNILYTKLGEERHPGFKLYRAIAHKVTQHTPQNQLNNPIFQRFQETYGFPGRPIPFPERFFENPGFIFYKIQRIMTLYNPLKSREKGRGRPGEP